MRALLALFSPLAVVAITTRANNVTLLTRACQPPFSALPYCNTALPLATRVSDFISRLWTNSSWIPPQLTARHGGGGSPGPTDAVPELGLPEFVSAPPRRNRPRKARAFSLSARSRTHTRAPHNPTGLGAELHPRRCVNLSPLSRRAFRAPSVAACAPRLPRAFLLTALSAPFLFLAPPGSAIQLRGRRRPRVLSHLVYEPGQLWERVEQVPRL